jgi:hypothetical protein
MAPKREGKGPKTPLTSSSSTKRPITRKNPDPEPIAVVPDPEKLLRKTKAVSKQSSLSKGKLSSKKFQGQSSEITKTQADEEEIPEGEVKPVVEPATVSFPSIISELNLDQWKLLTELIKQEYSNILPVTETLIGHNTDIKSELETPLSSLRSLSFEDFKSHHFSFENPLFLGPSSDHSLEEKSLCAKDQDSVTIQLSCHTQRIVSPPTSPIFLTPKTQTPKITNMAADRMDGIVAARYAPLILPQVLFSFPPNDYMRYLPRFNGDGAVTAEEHLSSFYSFADNFNVEHANVWMRLFM